MRSLIDIYNTCNIALMTAEPSCFEEANTNEEWKQSMKEEISAIERNQTRKLTDLPEGKEAIGLKWIF